MDPEHDDHPARAVELCRQSHARLLRTVDGLTDDDVRRPSRLPGWTVAHVLTHVARNADGHTRRLEGALHGEETPRYPGGPDQRDADIDAGADRPARDILADLKQSQDRLEDAMTRSHAAGWPHSDLLAGDSFPTSESPWRRLREVEMHHVDLGLRYGPDDWPEEYVAWELPRLISGLPDRLGAGRDRRAVTAWLAGRSGIPGEVELDPWT